MGAEPPVSDAGDPVARTEAPRRRQTPAQRRTQQRRKQRRRNYIITGVVAVLLIGGLVAQRVSSSRSSAAFAELADDAGCSDVESTGTSGGGEHLQAGERTTYDSSPPTHGKHAASPLAQGVYDTAFSEDPTENNNIYRAVHSLEHGAVIIWHDKLKDSQLSDLERDFRAEKKVLIAPYPQLKGNDHIALTAWGKLATCERPSKAYIDAFIERYRESKDAPERLAQI